MMEYKTVVKLGKGICVIFLSAVVLFYGIVLPLPQSLYADPALVSEEKKITSEAFIASDAGKNFQQGQYESAILSIDQLLQEYPQDDLLLRYKAIALDHVGRHQDAIEIFKNLILKNNQHVPSHYFLGLAFVHAGQTEQAIEEWRWVLKNGEETPYVQWSQDAIESTLQPVAPRARTSQKSKRWYVAADYGYEYDSNVILKPDDKSLATSADQNAGRQSLDFLLKYTAYSARDVAVDLLYTTRQTFHDDSLNEFNFHSEEFGIQLRKRVQMGNQDVILGLRYDFLLGILDDNLFSVRNRWQLSADTRFTSQTRTVFFANPTIANYGPDGFAPSLTSRDGFFYETGFTQYWYTKNFKHYLFIREALNGSATRGDNFDSVGNNTRIGLHANLTDRFAWDVSTGLDLNFYNHFSSISAADNSRRRDVNGDVYTALTYRLNKNISLRGFYRFINAANQNNFYDYTRHIGGGQIIFQEAF